MTTRRALIAALLATAACGGAAADLCKEAVDCEGGNEKDEEACIAEIDGEAEVAEAYGCKDDWDALLECEVDESSCQAVGNNNRYTSEAADGTDPCDDEENAYRACVERESSLDD